MKPPVNKQVYDEAAEWLVELRVGDVDAGRRERLDAWFRESPQHIRAFLELSSIWEDAGDPDIDRAHSTDELIALARRSTNVVPLASAATAPSQALRVNAFPSGRRNWKSVLAASVVGTILLAGAAAYWLYDLREPSYATRTGEERTIHLADGSSIELNSHSRVQVRFSARERNVDLIEGQALFRVSKDVSRPFVVRSDAASVRAVGTQFDVYRKESGTTVTVLEGRVAVLPGPPETQPIPIPSVPAPSAAAPVLASSAIMLAAGQQVTVTPKTAGQPVKADVATVTAWTQHQLVFDSTALADVAQEFNRYNERQLVVTDAGLTDFHVTGVFSSTDPSSLLRFLRAQRDITVVETEGQIRISKR